MIYKIPKITVDGIIKKGNEILLIRRRNIPFKNSWALPGGYLEYNEKTEDAVIREIFEETGLFTEIINLIGVYSDPKRDPRGHTVSIIYELRIIKGKLESGDDATDVNFFNLNNLPDNLAFDHKKVIKDYIREIS
ncbi:MAG: NUDIX hydrolase [Candidatus Thermoplasmatota archaeon]|jgi:8-oxo-dGTP diphosphatase|nr:NUDIX hydrolase [Candidatus Thermoplasmatota archaeon]